MLVWVGLPCCGFLCADFRLLRVCGFAGLLISCGFGGLLWYTRGWLGLFVGWIGLAGFALLDGLSGVCCCMSLA